MLKWIDRLAGKWLDWRTDAILKALPDDFGIKRIEAERSGWTMTVATEMIATIADQAAVFLNEHNAENYVQMTVLPRPDHAKRPILITVQWAKGESPAEQNERLRQEIERLRAGLTGCNHE